MEKKDIQVSENVKVKPTGIPFRCVVCNSFGTLANGTKVCHACDGKGWILIPAEEVKK